MRKSFYILTTLALCFSLRAFAGGGPDAYGYTWLASTDAGGPTFSWVDISTKGALVPGLADDNSSPGYFSVGFPFHYYWNDYSQMRVGSNGWISFSATSNIASCFPTIPTSGGIADDYLAAFMGDLNFTGAGNPGTCRYWSNGIDSFVVSYINVPFWTASAPGWTGSNSFQVILCGADSSITYQYQTLTGYVSTPGCVSLTVGIENSTGGIGLQTHSDVSPPSTYAIKFKYPNPVLLAVKDIKANWNQHFENKGRFYLTGIFDLKSNVRSVGNTDVTTSISAVGALQNSALTTVFTQTKTFPSGMAFGTESSYFYDPQPNIATPGQYRFNLTTSNVDDINPGNNSLVTEIELVDPCIPTMELGYSKATVNTGSINWSGGAVDDGVGTYIVPPIYPVTINSVEYYVSSAGSDGFIATLYDDDGPAGGAGTVLYTTNVASGTLTSGTWKTVTLPSPITITDGGFYVASFQLGTTYFIGTDNNLPMSRRNFEILDGSWSEFRYNSDQELMIRANVSGYSTKPVAGFTYVDTPGSLTVDFTHATSGATTILYNFGDASSSTTLNPSHTYATEGCYTVSIFAYNACDADTFSQVICVCGAPLAAYTWADTSLTVDFTDLSTGGSTSWFWDFGDGSTDTLQNPTHTYASGGVYNVCLIMTNCAGSDTICSTVNVACPIPVADYTTLLTGTNVDFTFTGSGATSYTWDFGDGGIATTPNPSHNYAAEGYYYVCLYVTSSCGSDTICDSITVGCPKPVAGFTQTPSGLAVDFAFTGTDATSWFWDFGDGGTSSLMNPSHTYLGDGVYYVCLYATNSCGTDTICDSTDVLLMMPDASGINVLSLSPNPTSGQLNVSGQLGHSTTLSILLTDMSGRTLRVVPCDAVGTTFSTTIDLSALPSGMYLLQVRTDKGAIFRRVVKE